MNVSAEDEALYEKLPSPPVAIALYFIGLIRAYFASMYRAYRRAA